MAFSPPESAPCSFLVSGCQPAPFARSRQETDGSRDLLPFRCGQLVGEGAHPAASCRAERGAGKALAPPAAVM